MSRRRLIWHVGLADAARPLVPASLGAHADALADAGLPVVASLDESERATRELLRTHREGGLRRRDVEGTWAEVCRRVWEHRGVSLLSTPDLCVADKDQIRLALDPLIGLEVHLVVSCDPFSEQVYGAWLAELRAGGTTSFEKYAARVLAPVPGHRQAERFRTGHDLAALVDRWGWTLRPERLHVLAERQPERQWSAFLEVAGLAGSSLPAVVPAYADPAGVAVLRRVNRQLDRQLEHPLGHGTSGRLVAPREVPAPMPAVPTAVLAPLAESWTGSLEAAGHDVRGDLRALVDAGPEVELPGARDQLGVAVDALADSLAESSRLRGAVAELEADRERLQRKRRKLRRRLAQATGSRKN